MTGLEGAVDEPMGGTVRTMGLGGAVVTTGPGPLAKSSVVGLLPRLGSGRWISRSNCGECCVLYAPPGSRLKGGSCCSVMGLPGAGKPVVVVVGKPAVVTVGRLAPGVRAAALRIGVCCCCGCCCCCCCCCGGASGDGIGPRPIGLCVLAALFCGGGSRMGLSDLGPLPMGLCGRGRPANGGFGRCSPALMFFGDGRGPVGGGPRMPRGLWEREPILLLAKAGDGLLSSGRSRGEAGLI